ncbi:response regulator transcription factor [Stenotrophomonas indicatrix]|uniref:response regulator transcription factor n=1 Tax=Stenotrophomonas indicatrix TaxID=2045451 RepID=UPI0015DEE1DC|nr:response regulator transcription factor [Stenotrophomonas indicatrix]MBA0098763.1 response regulator transcription factor [Stenotrophomonas indicatrix]
MSIRIVTVDDHPVLLAGLSEIIAGQDGLELLGEAKDSTELVELLSTRHVDVVVTDFSMPKGRYGDGVALLRFLQRRFPGVRLIVLTGIESTLVLRSILAAGITCIVGKTDPDVHLVPAIHAVMNGMGYLAPSIQTVLDHAPSLGAVQAGPDDVPELSRRESEVIRMYSEGLGVRAIAERVGRSPKTISTQKVAAMRKLGLSNDAEVFAYALSHGLIPASQAARGAQIEADTDHPDPVQAESDGLAAGRH